MAKRRSKNQLQGMLIVIVGGIALVVAIASALISGIIQFFTEVPREFLVTCFFIFGAIIGILLRVLSQNNKKHLSEISSKIAYLNENHQQEIARLKKLMEDDKSAELSYSLNALKEESDNSIKLLTNERDELKSRLKPLDEIEARFKELNYEIPLLENIKKDLDLNQIGFYNFQYDFGEALKYKYRLETLKIQEKELLKQNSAFTWGKTIFDNLSPREQDQVLKRIGKLALMAFYGEFDAILAKVKYSNINVYLKRIQTISSSIELLLKDYQFFFNQNFIKMKELELALVYEYQEVLYKEKEEQRLIREQMKEEERALREAQKAQESAEKEARNYEKALDQARQEMINNQQENNQEFLLQIQLLESKLLEANLQKERAKSQAELTRRGHVYIISNIGSFGENVYKIGMTRRLEPLDRVKELGDASVPFEFDVHAMIFSDDAPSLERKLHSVFSGRRVNQINERKEFFRVSLDEIEKACQEHCQQELILTKAAEAKEYKMTLAKSILTINERPE